MKLPKIRDELLQPHLTRPDWTKNSTRKSSLLFLDKNENTDETYVEFIKAVINETYLDNINNYPDCSLLYHNLAQELNVDAGNILLGAGSDGIIKYVFESFISRGDAVVYTEPTFAMYSVYASIFGARANIVGYKKHGDQLLLDVDLFLKTIHDTQPKLVCLPNPDSPTGTLVPEDQIVRIIEAAAKVGAAVLIDEAYYPFSEYTVLPLISIYSNLIVARTFSKAWGLAGARVGYAVANNELISYIHKVRPMYELGAISVAIVTQALNYRNEMLESVKRLNAGKEYFKREMERLGFGTLNSSGNFQHVAFGDWATTIHSSLSDVVLYRQDFPGTILSGYSRFSSATRMSFERIVGRITSVIAAECVNGINSGVSV